MYKVVTYRKVEDKKNLKGYLDIYDVEKKWMITGCSLFAKGERYWVNLPSRAYKNENGEQKYFNIIQMHKEQQDLFNKEVIQALKEFDPKAPKAFELKKIEPEEEQMELPFWAK